MIQYNFSKKIIIPEEHATRKFSKKDNSIVSARLFHIACSVKCYARTNTNLKSRVRKRKRRSGKEGEEGLTGYSAVKRYIISFDVNHSC